MYFMGFCLLSRGRVIVKKLDLARWREAVNTSWSLLTFAYFCSSSFSSRCNVLISVNNSGCLSLSLQELTSLQGVSYNWSYRGRWYGNEYTLFRAYRSQLVNLLKPFVSPVVDV